MWWTRAVVRNVDRQNKIWQTIVNAKAEKEIELFPMVNNYNIRTRASTWLSGTL